MTWSKYGECEGDDAVIRQKKMRDINPLYSGVPCSGSKYQMRMCQRSEDPITDMDGAVSIENNSCNGNPMGSIRSEKDDASDMFIESEFESEPEKSCLLIYFLIFILILTMCGCGAAISSDDTEKPTSGGSDYVSYE